MSYKTKDINPILMSQYNAMLKLTEFEDKSEIKDKLAKFIDATCINDAKKVNKIIEKNNFDAKILSPKKDEEV